MNSVRYTEDSYFAIHLPYVAYRSVVWGEVARYLRPYIVKDSHVLEIGAGYCHFINNVDAAVRFALDTSSVVEKYAAVGVEPVVALAWDLLQFQDSSLDVVLASNLFEHLTREQFESTLAEVRRVLVPGGKLIVIQPNFRYAFREYFDDYTHVQIFNDVGMSGYLHACGFVVSLTLPRFVPFSVAKLPFRVPALLVRLYLRSPWKPFAKQMLHIACPIK